MITRLKPGETLGTNRFQALRKRLDIVRGRESASNRALSEAQSALMALLGYITARGEQTAIDAQTRDELRTRPQNAIDGLPTQLGGEPLLP